jgi:meso-butanediol dehydrogenase/(S,S)-butanediol dehydrogenase/diacetyl reductase
MDFTGKTGIVTGATAGIGKAIALDLAARGAQLVITGRNTARGHEVQSAIVALGGRAHFVAADMGDPDAPERIVAAARAQFGGIDMLVNNAGILMSGAVPEYSHDDWNQMMDINVSSVFRMCRAVLPVMQAARQGAIVNIASDWALVAAKGAAAYCVSKAAVAQMTRCMALDHAREGIRVNAVCPGDTDTAMLGASTGPEERAAHLRRLGEAIPMGRVGTPQDVARLTSFLLSEDAGFMTGALVPVDGGASAD